MKPIYKKPVTIFSLLPDALSIFQNLLCRVHLLCAAVVIFGFSTAVQACPVCYASGGKESQWAYYGITLTLSLLPFLLLTILGNWIYKTYFKIRTE